MASVNHLIEVTFHPLATAALHMRLPRKPDPPATTSRFFTVWAMRSSVPLFIWYTNQVVFSYLPVRPRFVRGRHQVEKESFWHR